MFVYPLRCAAALALLALVPAVAAQSRRQLTGVVVDAQGQPVADAALQLWADARVDGTGAETVTARSDTKGAVRLELRPGRRYSGWASAADRVSAVAEVDDGVEALRLTLLPVPPCRLALAGMEAWHAVGPLRPHLHVPAQARCTVPFVATAHGATLPPLPPGDVWLEARTAGDEALVALPVERTQAATTVTLPAPVAFTVRVCDGDDAPLAGAVVRHLAVAPHQPATDPFSPPRLPQWRRLGVTDKDGLLPVRLPLARDPFGPPGRPALDCLLTAQLREFALGHTGWQGSRVPGGGRVDAGARQLSLPLRSAAPYRITLQHRKQPLARRPVRILARALDGELQGPGLALAVTEWAFPAVTDAQGAVAIDDMPLDAAEWRLELDPDPDLALPRCTPIPALRAADLDLGAATVVRVRVRDAAGRPVAGCRGVLMPAPEELRLLEPFGCEPQFTTDAAGRAQVVAASGRGWLCVCDGAAWDHRLIEVGDAPVEVELRLRPLAQHTLRVTDTAGHPVAGARFDAQGSEWIAGTPIPAEEILRAQQFLGAFDLRLATCGRSDAAGHLRLRFAPPTLMHTLGRLVAGGLSSTELKLDPAQLPADLVVR